MKYFKLIEEIATELNINYKILSDNYIFELEKNGVRKYIYAYKFPLNDEGINEILDDKYAFYSVIKNLDIKTIDMIPIYKNYNKNNLISYLNKNKEIILKRTHGSCGVDVFKINNQKDLFSKLDYLLAQDFMVILSPYYNIKREYRVIVLNNEVKLIYGKERPVIVGDGFSTIKELLEKFNDSYYNEITLQKLNLNLNTILPLNKSLEIDFKFNLAKGSKVNLDIEEALKNNLKDIAINISTKLNIKFASIDIIEVDDELLVLEANSGIMMDRFQKNVKDGCSITKSIYKEAINSLFD